MTHESQHAVLERILGLTRQVWPNHMTVDAIGISAPCPMAYTGLIRHAAVVPHWHDVPLAAIVKESFGVPVFMENDANLGALAEYHRGAGQGANPLVYMTLSTGIGGGLIVDGQLFTGSAGLAIEPGHLKLRDPLGQIRSLQDFASGPGIARLATKSLAGSEDASSLRDAPQISGKIVGEAALAGDLLARKIIDEAGFWLGLGLTNVMHMFNPARIVLGGSVTQLGELLLEPARQLMRQQVIDPAFYHEDLLRIAQLGDVVCLIGAAAYAQNRLQYALPDA
jgi:glucokinase